MPGLRLPMMAQSLYSGCSQFDLASRSRCLRLRDHWLVTPSLLQRRYHAQGPILEVDIGPT
jgi:hypothetical protein